jgi:hypothetical protein
MRKALPRKSIVGDPGASTYSFLAKVQAKALTFISFIHTPSGASIMDSASSSFSRLLGPRPAASSAIRALRSACPQAHTYKAALHAASKWFQENLRYVANKEYRLSA